MFSLSTGEVSHQEGELIQADPLILEGLHLLEQLIDLLLAGRQTEILHLSVHLLELGVAQPPVPIRVKLPEPLLDFIVSESDAADIQQGFTRFIAQLAWAILYEAERLLVPALHAGVRVDSLPRWRNHQGVAGAILGVRHGRVSLIVVTLDRVSSRGERGDSDMLQFVLLQELFLVVWFQGTEQTSQPCNGLLGHF